MAGNGVVLLQHPVNGRPYRPHFLIRERTAFISRSEPRLIEHGIAGRARYLQLFAKMQHHRPARRGAAGLEKGDVPRRNIGSQPQIELTPCGVDCASV